MEAGWVIPVPTTVLGHYFYVLALILAITASAATTIASTRDKLGQWRVEASELFRACQPVAGARERGAEQPRALIDASAEIAEAPGQAAAP